MQRGEKNPSLSHYDAVDINVISHSDMSVKATLEKPAEGLGFTY